MSCLVIYRKQGLEFYVALTIAPPSRRWFEGWIKFGLEIQECHDSERHLNRNRDFTDKIERIIIMVSLGRYTISTSSRFSG